MSNKPLLKHPGTLLFLLLLSSLIIELNATTSVRFNNDVRRPNFVLVLTDDLDQTLGGAASLVKTKRLIVKQGVDVTNWFVHTPVCCPSRSQLLTGRMFHNLKVANPTNRGCMHVDVSNSSKFYAQYYFARYFANQNYTVGVFGKHLNNDNPFSRPPVGVDRWLVNGGGNYHNPSFSWASSGVGEPQTVTFDNCTDPDKQQQPQPCYSTSVIGNASLTWIQDHLHNSKNAAKPFFAYISVKAPHIQDGPGFPVAIPAPWYTTTEVANHQAPRTPNYNASCPNHHWLVRQQSPLTEMQAKHVDQLYQSRLRTLLSVDDLVEDLISTLETAGVLHNTYIVFTSDNVSSGTSSL